MRSGTVGPGLVPADDDHDLDALLDRFPDGWSTVGYRDRVYGMTKITNVGGRSLSIYAEQLGGPDVISANVYRTSTRTLLKPCEMPAATVLAFLRDARPGEDDLPS